MNDLLYVGESEEYDKVFKLVSGNFPGLNLEKDVDSIHGYRLSIEGDADTEAYFNFLIDNDLAPISFKIQITARVAGKNQDILRKIINERRL